ncbi:MAG: class I SAM-dependent methyltransferase [Candidatus Rokubacteria bacterium]|nr:class I SAM-dependent methyltransferase [Candidatus Rokubacteria bacterium]
MTRAAEKQDIGRPRAGGNSDRPVAGSGRITRGHGVLALAARYFSTWHFLCTIEANVREGSEVLDFGCGQGTSYFPSRFHTTGFDVDFETVRAVSGPYQGAVTGDVAQLPFRAETFDAAVSSFVLEHLPFEHAVATFDELRRVLRPHGVLICLCDLECDHPLLSLVRRFFPDGYQEAFIKVPGHLGLRRERTWAELLTGAGFDILEWRLMSRFPVLDHAPWTYFASAPRVPKPLQWIGKAAHRVNRWGRVAELCDVVVVAADDVFRSVLPRSWAYRLLFVARKTGTRPSPAT